MRGASQTRPGSHGSPTRSTRTNRSWLPDGWIIAADHDTVDELECRHYVRKADLSYLEHETEPVGGGVLSWEVDDRAAQIAPPHVARPSVSRMRGASRTDGPLT